MRKSIPVFVIIIVSFFLAPFAHAAHIYGSSALGELIGSRSASAASIITGGDWGGDALDQTVAWNVTDLGGGNWNYEYTFTNFSSPDISHVILDLTDNCVPNNPGCVTDITDGLEFGTFGPAPANPGFPVGAEIVGVKFDFGGPSPFVISFMSNQVPVYGDFYAKGGTDTFAYNSGLPNHGSESIFDFIVRPNGVAVPEPGTLLLLGSGLIGLAAMARRRKP